MAIPLYSAGEVHALEAALQQRHGLSPATLMQRAGAALLRCLRANWPQARRVLICAGTGNNGGDGYVLARLAREAGIAVEVLALGEARADPAVEAARAWRQAGGAIRTWRAGDALPEADLIVDALFGIGLSRAPADAAAALIEAINASRTPVLAVDVPSGLDADRGAAPGTVVRAARTLCVLARKRGLYTGQAPDCTGAIAFDALGADESPVDVSATNTTLLERADLRAWLPPRPRSAHKGDHGHALILAGDTGMAGAARIAGEAALRAGSGWVSVATRQAHAAVLGLGRSELMVHGVEDTPALVPLLARATVLAVGPGLGQGDWSRALLAAALAADKPTVLDADALNLVARSPHALGEHVVITPHPGEAARLLACTTAEIANDRFAAARRLALRYETIVVLKGAGTIVDDGERCAVCPYGNPGMASAGMGDALTGVIVALLAQGLSPFAAACGGVLAHALAGDAAARGGERGVVAGDLIGELRGVVNP